MTDPGLAARTAPLAPGADVDLHAVARSGAGGRLFHRLGVGVAGRGVAWRGPVEEAAEVLAAIEGDTGERRPGWGPVAFGARPFDPGAPWDVVVPALTVGVGEDGAGWVTVVGPSGSGATDPLQLLADVLASEGATGRPGEGGAEPVEVALVDEPSPAEWCAAVAEATARIRAGQLDKVVLSRVVEARAARPFDVDAILGRLRDRFGGCYVFSVDGVIGATPELLVERAGDVVRSRPMAGSTPLTGERATDAERTAALFASSTYRQEHQVTIDVVHDTLLPWCSYVDYEPEPSVEELPNVAHLATAVEGRLSHPAASVLELAGALHPTPAVCGRPREAALRLIAELEPAPRGRYAGAVGWVDARGNGVWAVTLRCAHVEGATARLHAGCGLVADSDPATELVESRAKFDAVLSVLVPGRR